jgi:hypothetical protein
MLEFWNAGGKISGKSLITVSLGGESILKEVKQW